MALYTKVDLDACIACGACFADAPDVFTENDEGKAVNQVDGNEGTADVEEFADDINFAKDGCPTSAILVEEAPFA